MPTKPSSRRRVKCPCCGKTITVEVVSSLRPGDKHLAALMTGTLNRATCSDCKVEFLVETPLVYLDGQTSFIVYLLEPPEDGNTEALEREVDCMATEVFSRENLERPLVRLTFTYPDFIEKIKLRTLGYDDRLIEYAKYQLFQNISEERLSKFQHKLLLDFSNRDEDKLVFLVYDRETNKPLSVVHVPMEDFRTLEQEFAENLAMLQELDAIFPTCHVSADRLI
ncbi:MAG TPA: CpXC domain-containing protein [Lentisphaeria bacterium]|nr:CpXC domain-containing protein [Lentisphaeria bacterium]